ncbi:hypothetical protein [Roseibium sp. MMSF_3412]|uniref:hypothetical protein n=1 Tax=Roseibium sp. MMSF_3412 TaxID=3046712 RepID=UPI00273DB313|nr:hypothetical protein [Roseibium sp. MMSF_3412]
MAKIVVETAETKKKVTEALRVNDFQSAVEFYRENSATGQPFGTILNGDLSDAEHQLLLQINPSDDDKASGGFVIGFQELADAVYDALSYSGQTRALSDYPAFGEDVDEGFSEPKGEFGAFDPVAIMERKRAEAEALADALGGAADKLRIDVPRYDEWLTKMKRAEEK